MNVLCTRVDAVLERHDDISGMFAATEAAIKGKLSQLDLPDSLISPTKEHPAHVSSEQLTN